MSVTIHKLSINKLAAFTQLSLALWPEGIYDEELEEARSLLTSQKDAVYLAEAQETYIGFIHVSLRSDHVEGTQTSPVGYVEGIYVSEAYRQSGVASQLLAKAETWARKNNCTEIGSDTETTNQLSQHFHLHSGFTEATRIVCYRKTL